MKYNLSDLNTVRAVLSRHGFSFSKALGQNFLIDGTVCPRMAEAAVLSPEDGVLEIGPGIGVLTAQLGLRAKKVVAVELDKRLLPVLSETLGEFDNIEVVRLINSTISTTYAGQSVPLVALVAHTDWVDVTVPATVKNPDISAEVFTLTGNVSQEISYATVTGDVRAGDVVGSVTFYQNGQVLASSELIATEDVDAPGFLQSLGVTLQRIWCGIQGKPTVAQSAFYNSLSQFSDR